MPRQHQSLPTISLLPAAIGFFILTQGWVLIPYAGWFNFTVKSSTGYPLVEATSYLLAAVLFAITLFRLDSPTPRRQRGVFLGLWGLMGTAMVLLHTAVLRGWFAAHPQLLPGTDMSHIPPEFPGVPLKLLLQLGYLAGGLLLAYKVLTPGKEHRLAKSRRFLIISLWISGAFATHSFHGYALILYREAARSDYYSTIILFIAILHFLLVVGLTTLCMRIMLKQLRREPEESGYRLILILFPISAVGELIPAVQQMAAGRRTLLILVIFHGLITALWLNLLYQGWRSLQNEHPRMTPGKAVGFSLIPLFHLYWLFPSVAGYAEDYSDLHTRGDQQGTAPSRPLFRLFCYLSLILFCSSLGVLSLQESLYPHGLWLSGALGLLSLAYYIIRVRVFQAMSRSVSEVGPDSKHPIRA